MHRHGYSSVIKLHSRLQIYAEQDSERDSAMLDWVDQLHTHVLGGDFETTRMPMVNQVRCNAGSCVRLAVVAIYAALAI